MPNVSIDNEKCIGCGNCAAICEKTFVMDGDKAKVKQQPEELTCEQEAKESCPVDAISIS